MEGQLLPWGRHNLPGLSYVGWSRCRREVRKISPGWEGAASRVFPHVYGGQRNSSQALQRNREGGKRQEVVAVGGNHRASGPAGGGRGRAEPSCTSEG